MSSSQGDEKGLNLSRKDSFNLLYMLARGHSMCFLPFMRRNFGVEAQAWNGLTAFLLMLAVACFGRIPELLGFLGIWIVVMVCHRISTIWQTIQGVIRHSWYEGDLDTKFIRNRYVVKHIVEPSICLLAAASMELVGISHQLAVFIGFGFITLSFVAAIDRQLDNKRVQAMRDAAIEQSYLAARFRGDVDER